MTTLPPPPTFVLPAPPVCMVLPTPPTADLLAAAREVISKTRVLFSEPLPPAAEEPPEVTDWFDPHTRPAHTGIWQIQQPFGERHKLFYNTKKDCWYYIAEDNVSAGSMCCEGDSLHIIASGWRGLKAPAEAYHHGNSN